ncbi:MAG: hypothetical protein GF411_19970 [Candidatus Lokiarchaeota archaeon]|nr:hypothetical protein [Candidatus Lokiarchaeota archaeon]
MKHRISANCNLYDTDESTKEYIRVNKFHYVHLDAIRKELMIKYDNRLIGDLEIDDGNCMYFEHDIDDDLHQLFGDPL